MTMLDNPNFVAKEQPFSNPTLLLVEEDSNVFISFELG
jgi:hypothetical protein